MRPERDMKHQALQVHTNNFPKPVPTYLDISSFHIRLGQLIHSFFLLLRFLKKFIPKVFYQHVSSVDLISEKYFLFDSSEFCIFQENWGETTFLFNFCLFLFLKLNFTKKNSHENF